MKPVDIPLVVITGLAVPDWPPSTPRMVYRRIAQCSSRSLVIAPEGLGTGSLERYAESIGRLIQASFPGEKVILVGHSLGGLIARILQQSLPELFMEIITLGTPHRGLHHWASMVPLQSVREMTRGSRLMDTLELGNEMLARYEPGAPRLVSIGTLMDALVPYRYSVVEGAQNICYAPRLLGHLVPGTCEVVTGWAGHFSQVWRDQSIDRVAQQIRKIAMASFPSAA